MYACGFGVVVDYCVYVNTVMIDAVASFILEIVLQKIITVSSVIGKQEIHEVCKDFLSRMLYQ